MDKPSELKKRIREIVGANPNLPLTGVVEAVENDYCTVALKSGLPVSDVKLKATISNGNDYLKLIPKVGSTVVMISLTGDENNLTIIKIDEAEKIEYNQNGLEILIDSIDSKVSIKKNGLEVLIDGSDSKVSIKNDQVSLIDVFSDLATLLKQLKVFTPAGPSGTPLPDTIAAIVQLELNFNQLLK